MFLASIRCMEYFLTKWTHDINALKMFSLHMSACIVLPVSHIIALLALEAVIRNTEEKVIGIGGRRD